MLFLLCFLFYFPPLTFVFPLINFLKIIKFYADFDFSPQAFSHAIVTPALWIGIGCYVGAFAAWMTILRKSTLSAAFAMSAIVFVAVMFASWWVFGEHIGGMQLLGAAVIVAGILMLGADDATAHTG